ncbi:redox-sensitive transcriptional activator SoxR, partial [Acinetobacter soli]|uniref:redox-sensitive transcriptional activator SoxR n=1 Tax=Acinetobacter soli TaxID=487316 RepID=UPI000B4D6C53
MKQENLAQQFITIGELAKRSEVSVSTIRFYEEKQLIWSIRTNGNQRRYVRAMLRRIAIIKVAQLVGIRLEEVKQAFSVLPDRKMASKQDWENMSNLWKNQLEEKIQTLLQIRQQLDWCIG